MPDGLSYPALKCVVEHLEANKRIHIASRSPCLRRIEKSIPLHLDNLALREKSIYINNIGYSISTFCETINRSDRRFDRRIVNKEWFPGDIEVEPGSATWTLESIKFSVELMNRSIHKIVYTLKKEPEAIKTMICGFLGDRRAIYVNSLVFITWGHAILRLPPKLRLKIRNLRSEDDFRPFLTVINRSSFPLKTLDFRLTSSELLNHDAVKTAGKVIVSDLHGANIRGFLMKLKDLKNHTLFLEQVHLSLMPLIIRKWLETERDVGSALVLTCDAYSWVYEHFKTILEQLNEKIVIMKKTNLQASLIPTNFPTEAILTRIFEEAPGLKIKIKRAGSTTPFKNSPAKDTVKEKPVDSSLNDHPLELLAILCTIFAIAIWFFGV